MLYSEFAETVSALLASTSLRQKDLAERLSLSEPRVSRLLKGDANTTLRALADVGWALGYRFELVPIPLQNRGVTPADSDPPPPAWVKKLRTQIGRQENAAPASGKRPGPFAR